MNPPFLYVIVPVFNVERYIEECIESVLSQSFCDFELILVDDGSTDGSGAICDGYAKMDSRIKVYHKANSGVSHTRNFGIEKAIGQYVVFMDADDFYVDKYLFEKAEIKLTNNPDSELAIFQVSKYYSSTGLETNKPCELQYLEGKESIEEVLLELIKKDRLSIYSCDKFLKRDFLFKNNLFFDEALSNEEDAEWCLRIFPKINRITFIDEVSYAYRRERMESATFQKTTKHLMNILGVFEKYVQKYETSHNASEKVLLNYLAYRYSMLCGCLVYVSNIDIRKSIKKRLELYKWILKYNESGKVKKSYVVYKIAGLNAMIFVLGIYIKYRRFKEKK